MRPLKNRIFSWLKRRDSLYILAVSLISPVFFSYLPIMGFITYLYDSGIFSYDMFIEGIFGVKVFFILTVLFTLTFSLLLTGIIIPFIGIVGDKYFKKRSLDKEKIYWLLIFLAINLPLQLKLAFSDFPSGSQAFLSGFGLLINLYLAILLFCNAKWKFFSLIGVIGIFFFIVLTYYNYIAGLVQIGLQKFNMGGYIEVVITKDNDSYKKIEEGKLILLSPTKIFLKKNDHEIIILNRENKNIKVFSSDTNSSE